MTTQPNIGIWWDDGTRIVSFKQSLRKPDKFTGLCDSDDNHNDLWPEAAMQLGVGPDDEYFSIPRGRVLWDPKKKTSVIYHGNATSDDRLRKIAEDFGLTKWIPRRNSESLFGSSGKLLHHLKGYVVL